MWTCSLSISAIVVQKVNSHGAHLGVFVALMVEHSSTSFLLLASMNQR